MGKVSKRLLIVLLIGAFVIPMFVGCEKETPAPPTDYKAEFLGKLKTAADYNEKNIIVKVTGSDIDVTFNDGAKDDDILDVAKDIADALRDLTKTGTILTIDGSDYTLHSDLADFKTAMGILFLNVGEEDYSATIKYGTQTINLTGTIKVTDNRP